MKKKKEAKRKKNATMSPRGYTIDCYCCECGRTNSFYADGFYAYSYCHREARRAGWVLHKDGYVTCPKCKEELKNKKG